MTRNLRIGFATSLGRRIARIHPEETPAKVCRTELDERVRDVLITSIHNPGYSFLKNLKTAIVADYEQFVRTAEKAYHKIRK